MNTVQAPTEQLVLQVDATTWNRDSHELFDYESRHTFNKSFLVPRAAKVYRIETEVIVISENAVPPNGADFLLSVRWKDGRFCVWPADRGSAQGTSVQPKKLWLIIRHLPKGNYQLTEQDVVKLGRFKLRVRQMHTEAATPTPIEFKLEDAEPPITNLTPEESEKTQCRICLLEGGGEDDPLVRPCQCKGSIMYVHVECLRHWVNGRLNLTEDMARSCCFIRQVQCELCKTFLPSAVVNGTTRIPIVKVPNIQPPLIALENIVGVANKGVHISSMASRKDCKLGRGHESDVRIADVSISRFHAMIRYAEGTFLLEDHNSKFGTLVALRRPHLIEKSDGLAVQVGRTVLKFVLKEPSSLPIEEEILDISESDPRKEDETLGSGDVKAEPKNEDGIILPNEEGGNFHGATMHPHNQHPLNGQPQAYCFGRASYPQRNQGTLIGADGFSLIRDDGERLSPPRQFLPPAAENFTGAYMGVPVNVNVHPPGSPLEGISNDLVTGVISENARARSSRESYPWTLSSAPHLTGNILGSPCAPARPEFSGPQVITVPCSENGVTGRRFNANQSPELAPSGRPDLGLPMNYHALASHGAGSREASPYRW